MFALTKKEVEFKWSSSCEEAFQALKSLLINAPILAFLVLPSGKLARWGLALQEVDLSIFYRPGKKNVLADALSRAPIQGEDMP